MKKCDKPLTDLKIEDYYNRLKNESPDLKDKKTNN